MNRAPDTINDQLSRCERWRTWAEKHLPSSTPEELAILSDEALMQAVSELLRHGESSAVRADRLQDELDRLQDELDGQGTWCVDPRLRSGATG